MSEVTAWWGAATGSLGLALSGYNAWVARRQSRPSVRVEPVIDVDPTDSPRFEVRVINESSFPITVHKVGLVSRARDGQLDVGDLGEVPTLPFTIAARQRESFPLTMRTVVALSLETFDHAFVEPATGEKFKSSGRHQFVGKRLTDIQHTSRASKHELA